MSNYPPNQELRQEGSNELTSTSSWSPLACKCLRRYHLATCATVTGTSRAEAHVSLSRERRVSLTHVKLDENMASVGKRKARGPLFFMKRRDEGKTPTDIVSYWSALAPPPGSASSYAHYALMKPTSQPFWWQTAAGPGTAAPRELDPASRPQRWLPRPALPTGCPGHLPERLDHKSLPGR